MASPQGPAAELARRLRQLRERTWPDTPLTQRDLARVFGGSVPLISSWESLRNPTVPPAERLLAYAAFFATQRSVEQAPYRILPDAELTAAERAVRDELERELLGSRAGALRQLDEAAGNQAAALESWEALGGPWHFRDGKPVTLVCSERPREQMEPLVTPDDPDIAYASLYSYSDLDALMELYGHIRAANPTVPVNYRKATELEPDDYTTHLVLLGGIHFNVATRVLMERSDVPVTQFSTPGRRAEYQVKEDSGDVVTHRAELLDGKLITDIGHFFRMLNPFNHRRTVTICNGLTSRGVLGMVRALTDDRFRDRNGDYIDKTFADRHGYSLLTKVRIVDGAVLTPDWTDPEVRLHEWKSDPVSPSP